MRFVRIGLTVLALLLIGPIVVFWGWYQYTNRTYAARLFEPVPTERILATRRYYSVIPGFGCTFAVVTLPSDTAVRPPDQLAGREFPLNMPSEWKTTPGPELSSLNEGWFEACRAELGSDLYDRMNAALIAPGGWWDSTSELVFLYSQPERLSFRLRHGD